MKKPLLLFLAVLMISWACTNDEPKPAEQDTVTERVRPAAQGGTTTAYFSYTNSLEIADTLLSVYSSAAGISQVHETYETSDGMMGMREQKELIIKPGERIVFKQGGLHIMLMQLKEDVTEGDSVQVELEFAVSGLVLKNILVKASE